LTFSLSGEGPSREVGGIKTSLVAIDDGSGSTEVGKITSLRRARGTVRRLGVPFLTRRACSTAASNSTWSQRRSQISAARNPCLCRVPMPVSVGLGGLDQGLDLAGRQVLPGPKLGVRAPHRSNCSIYSVGVTSLRCDFAMENGPPRIATVRSLGKLPTVYKPESQGESNCRAKVEMT
jgi:hypothetical protein